LAQQQNLTVGGEGWEGNDFSEYTSNEITLGPGLNTLRFNANAAVHYDWLRLDVESVVIPEPASLALLGMLGLGVVMMTRRRQA